MKTLWRRTVAAFAALSLSTFSTASPATAAAFYETEVDQSKFIAVASPFGNNAYQLLVIEQISPQRSCWSESGSNPVVVDPLLLRFDFTGICSRSVDSNGYSIRKDGRDLGQQYILRVVPRNGELVLIGGDRNNLRAPEIVLGKTQGLAKGYLKIQLDPGWRFAKRTSNGTVLGHVYLASGTSPFKFRDIGNDVYATEIDKAVTLGFVAGFSEDNTFRPETPLTREQLVSVVVEGLGKIPGTSVTLPTQVSAQPYPDVEASRWSAAKIQWARDNNVVKGYEDGNFRPTQPVTRAELMAVERRAAEFALARRGQDPTLTPTQKPTEFTDTQGHWAADLISQMSTYCKVASPQNERGTGFAPNVPAFRNYAAAATLRMLNCVNPEQASGSPTPGVPN